jgi:hypothetical protein
MISQQQALDITIAAQKDKLKEQLQTLDIKIKLAAEKGYYEASIEEMTPILKEELRKLGYNVYTDPQNNWKVGWKNSA